MSSSRIRSHWWPRTRRGRLAVVAFGVGLLLAQPPVVFAFANRVDPWLLGLPFLYAYLTAIYTWLIVVLLVVWRWRL